MTHTSGWKVITKKHDYENDITIPSVVKPLAGGVDRIICEMGGNSKADYDHAALIARAPELQAESDRLRGLLRRVEPHIEHPNWCKQAWYGAADCDCGITTLKSELAEELKDV